MSRETEREERERRLNERLDNLGAGGVVAGHPFEGNKYTAPLHSVPDPEPETPIEVRLSLGSQDAGVLLGILEYVRKDGRRFSDVDVVASYVTYQVTRAIVEATRNEEG